MKTRLAYVSDLHLDMRGAVAPLYFPPADVLIIAGDVCSYDNLDMKIVKDFYDRATSSYPLVLMVEGNHEFYNFAEGVFGTSPLEGAYDNLVILRDETYSYRGLKFFGGTMWSGVDNDDQEDIMKTISIMSRINDFRYITVKGNIPLSYRNDCMYFYRQFVDKVKKADADIIISHFAPTQLSIEDKFKHSMLNPYFCNNFDTSVFAKPTYWIHGHVHHIHQWNSNKVAGFCNPFGYVGENREHLIRTFDVDISS